MIEHHLQKEILHKLVTAPTARFADLRPKNIDGNLFTYHLQQLIKQKYIVKNEDGSYALTPTGKAAGVNIQLSARDVLEQAHSIILLAVRDTKGAWLLRRRLAHPTYGQIGFIHGEPLATEPLATTATATLARRTGLTADFTVAGDGYIRIFQGEDLESFTHFTLLTANIEHAEPHERDETGENLWLADPDFSGSDMIISMHDLVQQLETKPGGFFVDLTYKS